MEDQAGHGHTSVSNQRVHAVRYGLLGSENIILLSCSGEPFYFPPFVRKEPLKLSREVQYRAMHMKSWTEPKQTVTQLGRTDVALGST